MLTCKETTDRLLEFLDNTLDPGEHAQTREHLEACKPCGEFFVSYKKTVNLCRHALCPDPPDGIGQRLMEFLKRETASKRQR